MPDVLTLTLGELDVKPPGPVHAYVIPLFAVVALIVTGPHAAASFDAVTESVGQLTVIAALPVIVPSPALRVCAPEDVRVAVNAFEPLSVAPAKV